MVCCFNDSLPEGVIFKSLNGLFDVKEEELGDDEDELFFIITTWFELLQVEDTNECLLELRSWLFKCST